MKKIAIWLLPLLLFVMCSCAEYTKSASPVSSSDGSLTVTGTPSLSASFVNSVLSTNNSPASGLGSTFYQESVSSGIDDAFALAFFMHESSFGTQGMATQTLNMGNLRYADGCTVKDGFAWFSSWSDSVHAWYVLISGPLYVGSGLTTVGQIVHKYAPSADSNDENAYTQAVDTAVSTWRAGKVLV